MPGGADDDYRVVIDEDSLDWRDADDDELGHLVHLFAELLAPFADGRQAAVMIPAYSVECWEQVTLADLAYTQDRRVPRDDRVRLARLLDKCRAIEPVEEDLSPTVRIGGMSVEPSFGLGHVVARARTGRSMSCLIVPRGPRPAGWATVESDAGPVELHLLTDPGAAPLFWRGVIGREQVPEREFFVLADRAFPGLVYADDLAFRHFDGSYEDVRSWLVDLLGAISDDFADVLTRHKGDQNQVMAVFSARGLDISPESPQTRKNASAWDQRLVTYKGHDYRCEWHGKRLWDRDRVHFSLPIPEHGNRVLIGIFTEHLGT
ncbi:hypothetical protein ACFYNO_20305 [Kitasatospora sp. NPDC006697]|uniref:hypothetical protein n=1 Tax=Kitasatospora sp. NPDC006697 TaxID=3364020 RepID=UPI00367797EC